MKRYLIPIMVVLVLTSGMVISCSPGLQTFNKYGISFKVAKELRLVEYTVNFEKQTFRIGTASYEQGAILSTGKNFTLLWLTTVPTFTQQEVRRSIFTTPDIFESANRTFKAEITGDLVTKEISGFEVTYASMRFTLPDWSAPGITAVWYCPDSQRTMQIILIHKQPETEMKRFIGSFSCTPHN